ncbi:MAG: hypothetical protein WKG32_22460 [Gemmatimonadaceae bacterium]
MPRYLLPIIVVDALVFLCTLGVAGWAQHAPGQDAAGRGMVWFFPIIFGGLLGTVLFFRMIGWPKVAAGIGVIPVVGVILVLLNGGRSLAAGVRESSGAAYFQEPRARELAKAVAKGDSAALRRILAAGGTLNVGDTSSDYTLLTFALYKHPHRVPMLLALGADPTLPDRDGQTVLMAAAATDRWGEALRFLDLGVDPRHVASDGKTTLATILETRELSAETLADPTYRDLTRRLATLGISVRRPAPAPP